MNKSHVHFLSRLILDMKYGVGGCAQRWCKALLLSTTEPENTVVGLIFCNRVLYYAIYLILPKPTAHTSRWGQYINKKSLSLYGKEKYTTDKHSFFNPVENSNLVLIILQSHHTSCGGSGSDLRGLKGNVTPRVKFIDCRRSHLHPYLCKHRCPFCWEAQFWWRTVQNGERHKWVG